MIELTGLGGRKSAGGKTRERSACGGIAKSRPRRGPLPLLVRTILQLILLVVVCGGGGALVGVMCARESPEPFAVIGDLHLPAGAFDETWVEAINESGADRLFILGDVVHGEHWRDGWERFDRITAGLEMPIHVVCGNHDVDEPGAREYFRERFGADYYAFTAHREGREGGEERRDLANGNGTRYVVLNTELEGQARERMIAWFIAELTRPCERRYVFGHKPFPEIGRGLTTKSTKDTKNGNGLPGQTDLADLAGAGDVTAVFSGHWHYFHEIDRPRYAQIVSGGGGNRLLRHDRAEGIKADHFLLVRNGDVEVRRLSQRREGAKKKGR